MQTWARHVTLVWVLTDCSWLLWLLTAWLLDFFLTFSFSRRYRWNCVQRLSCIPDVSHVFLMHFQHFPVGFLLLATTCSDSMTSNRKMLKMLSSNELWWKVSPYRRTPLRFTTQTLETRFFYQFLLLGWKKNKKPTKSKKKTDETPKHQKHQQKETKHLCFDDVSFVFFSEPRLAKSHGAIWVGSSEEE